MTERRCISCWQVKERKDLIKITKNHKTSEIQINPDSLTFGRSVYLCYNVNCIENAFKKGRIEKHLKCSVPKELKGQILDGLRIEKN